MPQFTVVVLAGMLNGLLDGLSEVLGGAVGGFAVAEGASQPHVATVGADEVVPQLHRRFDGHGMSTVPVSRSALRMRFQFAQRKCLTLSRT